MLVLNEQAKQIRVFFVREMTVIKNIRSFSRKKSLRQMLNFYNHWTLSYEISEMADIFNIGDEPIFDNCFVNFEFHTYNPYVNTTFEHSDDIRIPIAEFIHVSLWKHSLHRR